MSPTIPGRPREVLLVEDNPGDARLTREALKEARSPTRLTVAADGDEALAILHREGRHALAPRPDLVLLDLNLPPNGGRDVLVAIKQDPRLRGIPVVVLSSSRAASEVAVCYDLHANCYVTKPADLGEYLRVVQAIEAFWLATATLPPGE